MNRIEGVERSQTYKVWSRSDQFHFQRIIVKRFYADLAEVFDFSFIIFLPVLQVVQLISIRSCRLSVRAEDAFPGENEIARFNRVAIAPLGVFAKVESDFITVGFPLLGCSRLRLAGLIHTSQAFVHRFKNCVGLAVLRLSRVKSRRFCTQVDSKRLIRGQLLFTAVRSFFAAVGRCVATV
ncbi:hypothetical protein D1872_261100 [compost metagenome]